MTPPRTKKVVPGSRTKAAFATGWLGLCLGVTAVSARVDAAVFLDSPTFASATCDSVTTIACTGQSLAGVMHGSGVTLRIGFVPCVTADLTGGRPPGPVGTPVPGDLNSDGHVTGVDLAILLADWGPCATSSSSCAGDFNKNGVVDGMDLAVILANWG